MRSIYLSIIAILVMSTVSFSLTNVSSCQEITAPGTYQLISDLDGAPIDASPIAGTSCIKIASSDVELDCNLLNVENNGTGGTTIGIQINGTAALPINNVTVKNCPDVAFYTYGIYATYLNNSNFTNVTALNNTNDGFHLENCSSVKFYGCQGNNNNGYGLSSNGGGALTLEATTVQENEAGGAILIDGSNLIANGLVALNNPFFGINVDFGGIGISNSQLDGNGDGAVVTGDTIDIVDTQALSNTNDGIRILNSGSLGSVDMISLDASGNGNDGISLDLATNVVIDGSEASGNVRDGIWLNGSGTITIDGTSSSGNGRDGVSLGGSSNILLNDSIISGNTRHGISLDTSNLSIQGSSTSGNGQDGIYSRLSTLDMADTISYGNTREIVVDDTGLANITRAEIRPPSGIREDYSTISILDDIGFRESYSIKWVSFRGTLPPGLTLLREKSVEISVITGSPSIDWITLHWSDEEVLGVDEGGISVQRHDGAEWYDVAGDLNAALNMFIIRDWTSFSTFALFHNGSASYTADLYGANATNYTHLARYTGTGTGNLSTEGGNITGANISSTQLTDRWAAFYGNVSGGIFLGTAPNSYVYQWPWDSTAGGVMCLSTNSTLPSLVYGASGSDIDTVWSFGAVADNGAVTFNNSDCVLDGTQINGSTYADTGPAGGFTTCALKTSNTTLTSKGEMLFCGNVTSGTAYNGQPADFEVMVPTDQSAGATEAYYFFLSLN